MGVALKRQEMKKRKRKKKMAIKAKKMVDIKVQREMNEFSHPWVDFSGLSKDHSHFDMFKE